MKVLVIGSGGREHALCWKLKQSPKCSALYCAPGNPGISRIAEIVPLGVDKVAELVQYCLQTKIDLVVVGPEKPLNLGLCDQLRQIGVRVFGPSQAAAELEASKSFCKQVMIDAGVQTARYKTFDSRKALHDFIAAGAFGTLAQDGPLVLKADGLAAGKGVFVCKNRAEALQALDPLFLQIKADKVVAEEFLEGIEISLIVASDGIRVIPFAASHDYKRILDGDQGPNTGGMGSVCPTPRFSKAQTQQAVVEVIEPVLKEMKKRGTPFSGFLYGGLMLSPSGKVSVLEFNTRMGDPECQAILRSTEGDLLELLYELSSPSNVKIPEVERFSTPSMLSVCIVVASKDYPQNSSKGDVIEGIEFAESQPGVVVFHAGTALDSRGRLVSDGGRILNVTATAATLEEARARAYRACDFIQFKGSKVRRDIGLA